jgi:hypothetical protein
MQLKPGARLRSQVCTTEVIVIRAPAEDVDVACGGHAMIDAGEDPQAGLAIKPELETGSLLGKRYTDDGEAIELLVTKAGSGTLCLAGASLDIKQSKPLPSSD